MRRCYLSRSSSVKTLFYVPLACKMKGQCALEIPWWVVTTENKLMKHRMSRLQRAKQFMPFAALKGFEVLLAAVARPKEHRVELSEDQVDELNKVLQTIHCGEWVRIVYYNKQRYTELIGAVDMISAQMQIISVQGIDIPFRSIKELNLYDMTI